MPDCPGCREAERDPRTVIKYLGCMACDARAVADTPEFRDATARREMTPAYRRVLHRTFGRNWQQGHELAKQWHQAHGGADE